MDGAARPYAVVVDDNPLVLMDACQILEDAGFQCLEAGDGDQAWELVRSFASVVTLLFSDVEMPGSLNGFDLARQVAAVYPEIEVVLASGRLNPGAEDLPGRTSFIGKPFCAAIVHEHLAAKLPDAKIPAALKEARQAASPPRPFHRS